VVNPPLRLTKDCRLVKLYLNNYHNLADPHLNGDKSFHSLFLKYLNFLEKIKALSSFIKLYPELTFKDFDY